MLSRSLTFIVICFITCNADAQLLVGITGDFGNRIENKPVPPGSLIKNPITPSVSVMLLMQWNIQNKWCLQYGVAAGTLGYNIKILLYDTLSTPSSRTYTAFPSFATFYLNGNIAFGKHFQLKRRYLALYLGGGLTYFNRSEEEGRAGRSPSVILFEYYMSRKGHNLKGFTEVSVQTNLNSRIILGLRYRHHFSPALEGTYNFSHAKSSGQLFLTPKAFSILFLIRISDNRTIGQRYTLVFPNG